MNGLPEIAKLKEPDNFGIYSRLQFQQARFKSQELRPGGRISKGNKSASKGEQLMQRVNKVKLSLTGLAAMFLAISLVQAASADTMTYRSTTYSIPESTLLSPLEERVLTRQVLTPLGERSLTRQMVIDSPFLERRLQIEQPSLLEERMGFELF